MAIVLDLLIVRYMTPNESAISQASLLNLSLPMVSVVLGITQAGLSVYRYQYSQPPSSENGYPLQEIL